MQAQMRSHPIDPFNLLDPCGPELASRVESRIEGMAFGQIRDLQVICEDGIIVLRGRSRTHHAKQRAQEAALDVANGAVKLTNQIVVGS